MRTAGLLSGWGEGSGRSLVRWLLWTIDEAYGIWHFVAMSRDLTNAEKAVLAAVIDKGDAQGFAVEPSAEERHQWLEMIADLTVSKECECGYCPSIALAHKGEAVSEEETPDGILSAGSRLAGMGVMVFIYGGRPGFCEVVPPGDGEVELQKVEDLTFS